MVARFRAVSFATVLVHLQIARTLVDEAAQYGAPDPRKVVMAALHDANAEFKELQLSPVLRSQWERLMKGAETALLAETSILIREMHNNLMVELAAAWFLIIPADRRFVYEQTHPIFGQEVHDSFPDARNDIAAAGRCYALDEWTACIFHSMRALEHPLSWLGLYVGLTHAEVQAENWKNIIDRIEKKIRELEALPKSPTKTDELKFLSEAATQFRWFKDAWRNHVAHAHDFHDERSAVPIFLHVSDFFRHLASAIAKGTEP